jgi:hypothetical protein
MKVHTLTHIIPSHISLGNIFNYGNNQYANIYYHDATSTDTSPQPLYIHTPALYIPHGLIQFPNATKPLLEMTTHNSAFDSAIAPFIAALTTLEHTCTQLYTQKTADNGDNYTETYTLNKLVKPVYNATQWNKLLIPVNKAGARCFVITVHREKHYISDWNIQVPTYGIAVIHVRNVWCSTSSRKFGININIESLQLLESHILDINLVPALTNVELPQAAQLTQSTLLNTTDENPEYTIYFKMRKMGIPLEAIKTKMRLAGHNPTALDKPTALNIQLIHQLIHQHITGGDIAPPLPSIIGGAMLPPATTAAIDAPLHKMPMHNMLAQIGKGTVQLKKTVIEPKKKYYSTNHKMHKLEDILNIKARLKPTGQLTSVLP